MTSVDFDNLWALMSKYRFIPDPDCIQDDLTCLICKNLMIDSFESVCGCQYCYKCIQGYLGGENKHCPGKKRECKEEYLSLDVNVHRCAKLNRKISKLKVLCPNESCQCVEELSRMEDHLRYCKGETVDCPYVFLGCESGKKLKNKITYHLSEDIDKHTHLLLEYIQNINNDVSTLKLESKNNDNLRKEFDNLKYELEMTKSIVTTLREELRAKENIMVELKKEICYLKNDFEKSKLEILALKESGFEDINLKEMKKEIELLKEHSVVKEEAMEKNVNESMKDTNQKIDKLKETIERLDGWTHLKVNVGETFFSLDQFSVRKIQNEGILSPYFYSHYKGYKLRLKVYPGGHQGGKGTHLSIFFVICKGKYDDLLEWPCKHLIKISVVNQRNQKEQCSETLSYSNTKPENKHYYDKPKDKDNVALGYETFVSLKDLFNIVNDVVIIKCTTKAPL